MNIFRPVLPTLNDRSKWLCLDYLTSTYGYFDSISHYCRTFNIPRASFRFWIARSPTGLLPNLTRLVRCRPMANIEDLPVILDPYLELIKLGCDVKIRRYNSRTIQPYVIYWESMRQYKNQMKITVFPSTPLDQLTNTVDYRDYIS